MNDLYARIIRYVMETPWAIRPETMDIITQLLHMRAQGERLSSEEIHARIEARQPTTGTVTAGGVAVIPIHGVVSYRAGMFSDVSGMTSIEALQRRIRDALSNDQVSAIVLHVDSPGGSVDGLPEMASELRAARGKKRMVAVADTMAASAAYWLASQAERIAVTPSGEVGSIGVLAAHQDRSAQMEQRGVKTTLISAGKYKVEGNPFEPISEEAKETIQARVNDYYQMFLADVAAGRGVSLSDVRGGFGEGRMLGARQAVSAGMADEVATLEEVVASLQKPKPTRRRKAAINKFAFI